MYKYYCVHNRCSDKKCIFAVDFMVKDFFGNLEREAGVNPAQYPLL